jgi:methylmalonyl-CoA mutase cobalamin-binding subunit
MITEWQRSTVFSKSELPDASDLLAKGRALARDWQMTPGAFLKACGHPSEADYKRAMTAQGRTMRHAHMGFRDFEKSRRAWIEIYEACAERGVQVDRIGITLDWSMGVCRANREGQMRGTGLVLGGPEEFAALTRGAAAAPHFGDFVLGFPAAVENTQAALAAGSTSIGNLGQYFTFRLPGDADDIAATSATLTALGLIAAQNSEVLVHSNLDDGFAAVFADLSSVLGAALVEQYIVEELIGAPLAHCYGHHFTDPLRRMAFHLALGEISTRPGTMVYGNTVSYRGNRAENYASLAHYLAVDIAAQRMVPSGHAVNPVPVSENERIPDIAEIIDAQCFAARMIEQGADFDPLMDLTAALAISARILEGAARFKTNLLSGFENAGLDIRNPFEMLLVLRRIGGKRLEEMYGAGAKNRHALHGRRALVVSPLVASPLVEELEALCAAHLGKVSATDRAGLAARNLTVLVAATDVHEHGKMVLDRTLETLGVRVIDGGVSTDADALARLAAGHKPDAIAVSTYNGIALTYVRQLNQELAHLGVNIPVLIGGKLNQIPDGSNTSLPVDVTAKLGGEGAIVCAEIEDAVPALLELGGNKIN